jgi:putative membrane protein
MTNGRSMTAFVLTLSLTTLMIGACERPIERYEQATPEPGGGITVSPTATTTPMGAPTATPSENLSSFDQEFMMNAARSGMMEVQLGNMASQKASSNDVKRLGQRLATDHSRVNQKLQQLASSLNVTLPQELTSEQLQNVSQMQDASGKEFDRGYVSLMINEHTKDISEFERAANQATNADLKRLASETLPILREHLQLARNVASKMGIKPSPTP